MKLKEINSLVELFFKKFEQITSKKFEKQENIFLVSLKGKSKSKTKSRYYSSYSWGVTNNKIRVLSDYIKNIISNGDKCILLSENRPEWLISDIAIMNAGGVTVPLFTTYSESDYKYIIHDCEPKICIVSNIDQFKKINNHIKDGTILISIDQFDENIVCFDDIFEKIFTGCDDINQIKNLYNKNIRRNDLACIIYTSGTTGNPKGVMLSHGGILSNCDGAKEILESLVQDETPVFLTWLPLSHSYEHTVQYVQIYLGAKVFYAESLEKLLTNISIAKPTIMTAVPRFYQNLYSKISLNFSKQKGFKKKLISSTISLGTKKLNNENLTMSEKLINFFCEKLVRNKIKNQLFFL